MSRLNLFLIILFLCASCDINNSKSGVLDDVKDAKNTWNSSNPQNYSYNYQSICFCFFTEDVRVIVREDSVVDVQDISTDQTIMVSVGDELVPVHEYLRSSFYTINEFFQQLEVQVPVADDSTVEFDRVTGMPIQIYFDYIEEAIDDEITYLFSELNID